MRFISPVIKPLLAYQAPKPVGDTSTFRVTSPFAPRADGFHGALDIGNYTQGDPVVATMDGVVHAVGNLKEPWSESTTRFSSGNYGGLMVVLEDEGVYAIYAHLMSASVEAGQIVKAGQTLGRVGQSGAAGGQAHLHFGLQAPRHRVPAGINTKATAMGIGLDVDPWPLITGQAEILPEEDMELPAFSGYVLADVGAGNRLRKEPNLNARYYLVESTRTFQLVGFTDEGGEYVLGGKTGTRWAILQGENTWFCAAPLVGNIRLDKAGVDLAPADTSAEKVAAALAAHNKNLDTWAAARPKS